MRGRQSIPELARSRRCDVTVEGREGPPRSTRARIPRGETRQLQLTLAMTNKSACTPRTVSMRTAMALAVLGAGCQHHTAPWASGVISIQTLADDSPPSSFGMVNVI